MPFSIRQDNLGDLALVDDDNDMYRWIALEYMGDKEFVDYGNVDTTKEYRPINTSAFCQQARIIFTGTENECINYVKTTLLIGAN